MKKRGRVLCAQTLAPALDRPSPPKRAPKPSPKYKFIVDGEWRHDPNQPAMYDEMANVNNVIEVQEYAPENLDNVSGFDPPPSPPSSYCNPPPAAEDYAKEPPVMPPHLQLTLLNVPAAEAGASLPRPQHVILGHLYLQRGQVGGLGRGLASVPAT
jgi:5'-AMP-activated protein kinase regulatory beta subunit